MPTLTINGTLITELAELKKELGKINDAQSYTARAVRTHFHTGALQEWLNEGDENEQRMAAEISRIDRQQGDSDLLNNIVSIICEESAQVIATDPSRYLSLEGVAYSYGTPDGPQEGQLNSDTITLQEGVDGISLMVTFKVQESCNESFEVSINAQDKNTNNKKVLAKERVNLSDYPKGKLKKFFFYCAKEDAEEYELNICVDDTKVKSFRLKDANVFTVGGVSFWMIKVEGGTFTMGATSEMKDPDDDERPTHQVTLSSYYIGETPVTQELWEAVMGSNPSYFKGDNRPVESVAWYDCQNFIEELNVKTGKKFRLLTEAEWEFAARGGNKSKHTQYSGSDNLDEVAWHKGNSGRKTHPVKQKKPNELGVYDMSGNVREWCQDMYEYYYYKEGPQTNPTGPWGGSFHVNRGGSLYDCARDCRLSYRSFDSPDVADNKLGLRLALSE